MRIGKDAYFYDVCASTVDGQHNIIAAVYSDRSPRTSFMLIQPSIVTQVLSYIIPHISIPSYEAATMSSLL